MKIRWSFVLITWYFQLLYCFICLLHLILSHYKFPFFKSHWQIGHLCSLKVYFIALLKFVVESSAVSVVPLFYYTHSISWLLKSMFQGYCHAINQVVFGGILHDSWSLYPIHVSASVGSTYYTSFDSFHSLWWPFL